MSWKLVWTRPALKDLKKIGQQEARRIRDKVKRFAETGHGDVKKLTDVDPPEWRQRVGQWRVFIYFQRSGSKLRTVSADRRPIRAPHATLEAAVRHRVKTTRYFDAVRTALTER